jgi:inosine-uridine nucleoside N-ribohydrolase
METTPTRLIIDTDLFSDVDDAGALAVAHRLADTGAAEVAAIGINTPSKWGHEAAQIISSYYGRPHTPVGALLPLDESVFERDYARHLCESFSKYSSGEAPRPAVDVFREALAQSPDCSTTLVSIGFFPNLVALVRSAPDEISPLSGAELLRRKLSDTVVMGGQFPEGKEFNISSYPAEARAFIDEWPTPILFVGFEVGADVVTGYSFPPEARDHNPIAAAYDRYSGSRGRASWDLISVSIAVQGVSKHYDVSPPGRVRVSVDGANSWTPDPSGKHQFVLRRDDPRTIAANIESLLTE